MKFHPSRFEQATGLTDILLGFVCIYVILQLTNYSGFKADVWSWAFGLLGFSSMLGAISHGFVMTEKTNQQIWMPINLSLGLALGLFVVGALFDLSGEAVARKTLPFMLAIGFLFFLVTIWRPGTFMTFIAYEAITMLFALGVYVFLLFKETLPGAGWMVTGILITILAAGVQAVGKTGKSMLWYFDNNSIFHFIQMVGIILLMLGLKISL